MSGTAGTELFSQEYWSKSLTSRFTAGAQLVFLSDVLRREFPTAESIVEALEMIIEIRTVLDRSHSRPEIAEGYSDLTN